MCPRCLPRAYTRGPSASFSLYPRLRCRVSLQPQVPTQTFVSPTRNELQFTEPNSSRLSGLLCLCKVSACACLGHPSPQLALKAGLRLHGPQRVAHHNHGLPCLFMTSQPLQPVSAPTADPDSSVPQMSGLNPWGRVYGSYPLLLRQGVLSHCYPEILLEFLLKRESLWGAQILYPALLPSQLHPSRILQVGSSIGRGGEESAGQL